MTLPGQSAGEVPIGYALGRLVATGVANIVEHGALTEITLCDGSTLELWVEGYDAEVSWRFVPTVPKR